MPQIDECLFRFSLGGKLGVGGRGRERGEGGGGESRRHRSGCPLDRISWGTEEGGLLDRTISDEMGARPVFGGLGGGMRKC